MIHLKRSLLKNLKAGMQAAIASKRAAHQPAGAAIVANPLLLAVRVALQQAVELEHATIPVYLYALYSLDATKNPEIANIISSVAVEEMLHMTLASNILNALGGSPRIDQPGFIPAYPGPLPGGVENGLIVSLAPFSMSQLETFLNIEQPEDPLEFPTDDQIAADLDDTDGASMTIGEFYTTISKAIAMLGDSAFVSPPPNQIGPDIMFESVVVSNVATAQQAIQIIIDQGEGTSSAPEEVTGGGVAHYYRFRQILEGHYLVVTSAPGVTPVTYAYSGVPIVFDPSGVYAVPINPKVSNYPPGSAQRFACNNFNYSYTALLMALHTLFNTTPDETQFNKAIGLMMSLKSQAKAMMSGIPNPALLTGPSFQYQPVNPGTKNLS